MLNTILLTWLALIIMAGWAVYLANKMSGLRQSVGFLKEELALCEKQLMQTSEALDKSRSAVKYIRDWAKNV